MESCATTFTVRLDRPCKVLSMRGIYGEDLMLTGIELLVHEPGWPEPRWVRSEITSA